ncbi:hypothetical protein [Nocardia veterana]|uniref:Uncharacterized protein n=1 Tax=Nocardia veterana TaxID=132249 RepID=A0A7X6LZN5_9NOCA|nr:hypothetical protein [Nocardia veterana]NKY87538.1 hypothetical protein [Nocardia veterana]
MNSGNLQLRCRWELLEIELAILDTAHKRVELVAIKVQSDTGVPGMSSMVGSEGVLPRR